jgi:hypothetical protein
MAFRAASASLFLTFSHLRASSSVQPEMPVSIRMVSAFESAMVTVGGEIDALCVCTEGSYSKRECLLGGRLLVGPPVN